MVDIYNLEQEKEVQFLEVVHALKKANDVAVPYQICERRAGDITIALPMLIKQKKNSVGNLKLSLEEALRTVWQWQNI